MTHKQNVFEQYVECREMDLSNLRYETIGNLIDFMNRNLHIVVFKWGGQATSNIMKARRIGVGIGFVDGLVTACCLEQETLALIGVSGVVLIAFAVVGALFGAGAVYVVGKCLDKIKVTNMQRERSC